MHVLRARKRSTRKSIWVYGAFILPVNRSSSFQVSVLKVLRTPSRSSVVHAWIYIRSVLPCLYSWSLRISGMPYKTRCHCTSQASCYSMSVVLSSLDVFYLSRQIERRIMEGPDGQSGSHLVWATAARVTCALFASVIKWAS